MPSVRPRLHRLRNLGLATTLVLAVNAAVLAGGWAGPEASPDVAAAAVALASTAEVEPPVDPFEGVTVTVPIGGAIGDVTLPVPEDAPANAYAATPEIVHGQLEIPKIGLSQPLFEGVTLTAINRGPSHWPGTAMPGEVGNVVVAGHRTTYTKPFWALNELVPGDELVFVVGGERIVYELERLETVYPDDVHIIDQSLARRATLFACHPRGSARQRIVAHFRMPPEGFEVELGDGMGFGGAVVGGV